MAASDEVSEREQKALQWLAANVRHFRRKAKLTQAQLATELEISFVTIRAIERGVHSPSFKLLIGLSVALRVSPVDLLQPRAMAERRPGRPKR